MPANTPHVGVRTFLQTTEKQPFIIADMSTIGGAFTPGTGIDRTLFPVDTPVHFTTDDDAMVAGCGTGTLRQAVDAIISEGIVASVVAVVPDIAVADDTIDEQMVKIVGSPSGKTGLWALLDAEAETGVAPDILIAPGFTSQRLSSAANPAATAIDALCERIVTAVGVCDAPSTNKTDAVEWTADFTDSMNLIAVGQSVRVYSGTDIVTRPASPQVAALIAKTDKNRGAPYYNPGNQALIGILGPNRPVGFAISDPDSEANFLIQRGVNSLVQINKDRTSRKTNSPQGKTFWGFVNTSTDPLWRAINVVRTRKAVREVVPRTLVKYIGRNLGVHLVTVLLQSLEDFLSELKGLPEPAILGGEVKWDRNLNSNATMRVGGLNVTLNFEEAPPLLDLGIYTGRYEHAFDILADEIEAAMAQYNVRGALDLTTA
jgi:phage tail sheath protein FI